MFILDSHCDSPTQMLRLRDFSKDNPAPAQVDFPKMIRGGVGGAFFALYIPASLSGDAATARAYELLDALEAKVPRARECKNGAPKVSQSACEMVRCAAEAIAIHERGLVSVFLGLENGSAIQEDFGILDDLAARGVRYVTLTHSADNQICDSCTGGGRWGGLSPFGREMVEYMDSTDVYVDLAHCSDATMEQVLDMAHKPVLYTHGCCRAISSHRRNITDKMLRRLADGGGVAGMSVYPPFLSDEFRSRYYAALPETGRSVADDLEAAEVPFIADPTSEAAREAWEAAQMRMRSYPRPGIEEVCDHICHAVNVAGIEGVGIGTDFDGIELSAEGLEDISCLPRIFDALSRRGFSDDELELIAGRNFLRLL